MFDSLFPSEAAADDVIIKQGDEGDNFYIIDQVQYYNCFCYDITHLCEREKLIFM